MKAFVLKGHADVGFIEKKEPSLESRGGVLLRPVVVSPCTSDVHTVWQGSPKKKDLTLGHECVAQVVEAGEDVKDFSKGDIVAVPAITPDWDQADVDINPSHAGHNFSAHMLGKSIDGAFQELFYLPHADKNLALVPDGVTLEQALMCVDVVSTGFTAVEEGNVKSGDTVVVMGIGGIGLAAIMGCRLRHAARIFAVGSRPENVRIAEDLGAEVLNYKTIQCGLPEGMHPLANSTNSAVVNYVLEKTKTKGADEVLICGGSDLSFPQAVDMVKYGTGTVSNVMYYGASDGEHENGIDSLQIPKFSIGRGMAGKTLKFSLAKGGRKRIEYLLSLCQQGKIHPEVLITKRYDGLENIEQALYDMKDRKAIKIAVTCSHVGHI